MSLPGGYALEVEHDRRVWCEGGLLLEQRPQDGRGGREDDLVGPQRLDGPFLVLGGEGHVEELGTNLINLLKIPQQNPTRSGPNRPMTASRGMSFHNFVVFYWAIYSLRDELPSYLSLCEINLQSKRTCSRL